MDACEQMGHPDVKAAAADQDVVCVDFLREFRCGCLRSTGSLQN